MIFPDIFFTFSKFSFYGLLGKNQKLWKNEKNICRYHHLLLIYGVWRMVLFFILDHFLSFYPANSPKNQNEKKKMKKKEKPLEISSLYLHKCTKNHDQMQYCFWDMTCDKCNYFSFWAIFSYVYPKLWSDDVWFLKYGAQREDGKNDIQR